MVNVRTEREVIDEHNGRLTDGIKEAVVEKVSVDKLEFVMLLAVPPHPAPKLALHDLKEERIVFKGCTPCVSHAVQQEDKINSQRLVYRGTECGILSFLDAVAHFARSRCCRLKNYLTNA